MDYIRISRPHRVRPRQAAADNSPLAQREWKAVGTEVGGSVGMTVQGLPLVKPPWGRITAIDLNRGEIVWHVAHGETPNNVRNHPALKGLNIPRTGGVGRIGTLVTKTLSSPVRVASLRRRPADGAP